MRRYLFRLAVYASLAVPLAAQTTPAKPDTSQEALVFDRIYNLIRFENDGTGIRDTTAVIHVQSQAGVQAMGQLIFGYSSATENLEVQYVRVRKPDGQVIETPPASAQDFAPDVLQEAPMYSDYRQRHISVVSLQPGDVLEYRTITHVTTPLAPHEFWYEHTFPSQAVVHDDKLVIDIPRDRTVKLKSPKHKFDSSENGDRRIYTWTIQDFVPERKSIRRIEEDDDSDSDDGQPDVQLSTFENWQQVATWYAKLQGERVVVNDAIQKKAADLTRGATTPAEKARRLYDYVARNIRYVSLSFGVGRLQPHLASEVLQNGYGDCKDKHTLLETLLRAEGIKSYPVLINSSIKLDPDVPSPGQFDHEITAVKLGEHFTWLDATAEIAPYGMIFYQLRNKQALLATDDAGGGLIRTPADSPVKNQLTLIMDGKFTDAGALDLTIDIAALGDSDVRMRGVFRSAPEARWQDLLQIFSRSWGIDGEVSDVHVDSIEDTTKAFHAKYHLHKSDYFRVPNAGVDFRLLPPLRVPRPKSGGPKHATEPLDVGPAGETIYRAHIQFPVNYSLHIPASSTMKRDYGEYSSSYDLQKNVLDAERHLILKVNELPASRRSDYESFRTATGNEIEQVLSCSITAPTGAVSASAKPTGSAQDMQDSAAAALQRRDFAAAVELLKSVVDKEPTRKDAWDQLGRAYAGLNQHDQAIAAFRKQIEVDEYHPRANNDLAAELQQQGKLEEAAAAYRKQIEVTPYDKLPHKSLGLLLVQMKRDDDARPELEAAAAIPPEDPEVKMALAGVYSRTGNAEKAAALMKGLTGASAPASGGDMYASALKDDVDPNQSTREARHTLAEIGDQFDSGEFDRLGPSAFSAMNLVALAWARIGWASYLHGESMEAMQYLNSAWLLSQSGTVGNRLARVFEKEGQKDKARHMYALALAAGGSEAEASRQGVTQLAASAAAAEKEITDAATELLQLRTVQLAAITSATASAKFALVFDSATKPERAEFQEGDPALNAAGQQLQQKDFPVKFPDVSSIKIVRRATLSCANSKCAITLLPPEAMNPATAAESAATR